MCPLISVAMEKACRPAGLLALAFTMLVGIGEVTVAFAQTKDTTGPPSPLGLGEMIKESEFIFVLQVTGVDRRTGTITYQKLVDLKGKFPRTRIEHPIGLSTRPARDLVAWAEV